MTDPKPTPDEKPEAPKPEAYEPPRLTRVGNLKDLLGKSGATFDNPNPHLGRP